MNIPFKKQLSPYVELFRGIISYIPGFNHPLFTKTGGTNSAQYCYSVWMRHLIEAKNNKTLDNIPNIVAELGPGDSLGIGLCALLSGSKKYYAFDVMRYANTAKNIEIFNELKHLFKSKKDVPDEKIFPLVKPYLKNYKFPKDILSENVLRKSLDEKRLKRIEYSIKNPNHSDSMIVYQVPWDNSSIIKRDTVDMIFSQATLEHIDDISGAYRTMYLWLRKDGFMTHQIDLKCHGTSHEWNGHWKYSKKMWKLIRGKRSWLLNRLTYKKHLELAKKSGFSIIKTKKIESSSNINTNSLNKEFKEISNEELKISGLFFIAKK